MLARALEQDAGANILSTPTLLTLDNEEARIIVGQNVPFVTGQYATTGIDVDGAAVPDDRAQGHRRHAAREAADHRRRARCASAIYQEVSRIELVHHARPALVLSKRALESSVIVDDQQIVVLGGLIQDSFTDGSDKRAAASATSRSSARSSATTRASGSKINLLIFLKPTVVRTDAQGRALTSERYDYIMGEQQQRTPPSRATSGATRPCRRCRR